MVNMLYPGFYPGKKPIRDMRPVGRPYEKKDDFMYDLLAKGDYLTGKFNLPNWVIEKEQDEIAGALTVSSDVKAPQTEILFGVEDVEEAPGGTVKISPKKLSEDFWGGLKKALGDNAIKSITDPDELRAMARADIWREEMSGTERRFGKSFDLSLDVDKLAELGAAYKYFKGSGFDFTTEDGKNKKLAFKDLSPERKQAFLDRLPAIDSSLNVEANARAQGFTDQKSRRNVGSNYGQLANDALGFQKKSAASGKRSDAYYGFAKTQNKAINEELKARLGADGFASLSAKDKVKVAVVKARLDSRQQVNDSMGGVTGSLKDVQKSFGSGTKNLLSPYAPSKNSISLIQGLQKDVKKARTNVAFLGSVDVQVNASIVKGVISAKDSFAFSDTLKATSLSKDLKNLEDILSNTKWVALDSAGNITKITNAPALVNAIKAQGGKFTQKTVDKGSHGKFIYSAANSLNASDSLQDVLNLVDSSTGEKIMSDASRGAKNLGGVMSDTFDTEGWADFLEDLSEGKIPTQFVWNRFVKPRIEKYTPSYWIGRGKDWALKNTGAGRLLQKGLTKYAEILTGIQGSYMGGLLAAGFGGKGWEIMKERLSQAITTATLAALKAWTGGISKVFEKVLKVVIRFVVNKVVDYSKELYKALVKLDFYAFEKLTAPIFKAGIAIIFVIVLISMMPMFIIMSLLSVFPENDVTRESTQTQTQTGSFQKAANP